MLFVYARHTPDCDHRDDPKYRRCRCPRWIDGYLDGQRLRQSAKTRRVKRSTVGSLPTGWFPKPEFQRIIDATYAYGDWRGGRDFHFRADRLRALVLLMRWSELAIQDAVTLERDRLSDDDKLFLYRTKTGVPVQVPFPPDIAAMLRALPSDNPRYFFWSGKRRASDRLQGLASLIDSALYCRQDP